MKNPQGASSQIDPTKYNISWLEHFLHRTRRRYWMLNGLSAVLESTLGLALLAGILAIFRAQMTTFSSIYLWWWAGVAVALLYIIRTTYRHFKTIARSPIAEQVESWNPQASGFLTAIELGRDLPGLQQKPRYSASLSQARIDQVASTMRTLHPMDVVPVESFRRRAHIFLGVAALFFGALIWFPHPVSETLGSLFYPPEKTKTNPLLQADHDALVVGDLKVTYRYPAYSGRGIRTLPNSDGSLSALKGTRVTLQARSLYPIERAALHVNHRTFIKLRVSKDKREIIGNIDLIQHGFYRFVLNGTDGTVHRGPTHPIQIQEDKKPKVKLLWPKRNLELQSEKSLRLAYRFSDDFGISKVYLVYQNKSSKYLNKPERKLLQELPATAAARSGVGDGSWDLQTVPSSPGDRIAYYIEVHDNDTISGPNKGRSETRYITLFSPLKEHQKLVKAQEALLGKMTLFLADLLEMPSSDQVTIPKIEQQIQQLNGKGQQMLSDFDALIKAMRKGSLTKPYTLIAMENLQMRFEKRQFARTDLDKQIKMLRKYTPFLRRNVDTNRSAEIPPQEDDVYAFSLLLNRQQLDLIAQLARQLSEAQNRLRDLLEKYKQKKDPDTKRELLRQMDRVKKLIQEINRRMNKLHQAFSEGFVNRAAVRKQQQEELNDLKALRKDIKEDKLESAAKRLAKLATSLEKKIANLDQFAKEAGGQLVSRMAAAMQKMLDDLQQLEQKQRRLSNRTEQLRRKLLKRMQTALKGKLDAMLNKQLKRAEQIERRLQGVQQTMKRSLYRYRYDIQLKTMQQRIKDLKRLLKHKDVFESLDTIRRYQSRAMRMESSLRFLQRISRNWRNPQAQPTPQAKRAEQSSESIRESQKIAEKIEHDLSRFFPSPKPYMKPQDKALMKRYQQYQKMLRREASQLEQKLKRMAKRMPMFQPKMIRQLSEAAKEMRQASQRLGQQLPKPAHGHQQKAIQKLQQCQNGMKQSMQPQGGKNGKGDKDGKSGGQRGGQGKRNGRRFNQQKVKIPKPGDHKAPKALRQDILDAMKEKLPHRYRQPVRKYYEKLVK